MVTFWHAFPVFKNVIQFLTFFDSYNNLILNLTLVFFFCPFLLVFVLHEIPFPLLEGKKHF